MPKHDRLVGWWLGLPIWAKVLTVLPISLVLIVLVTWAVFSARKGSETQGNDPLDISREGYAKAVDRLVSRAEKRDADLVQSIESNRTDQAGLDEEDKRAAQRLEEDHEAIDNASSIADVDDALRRGER